MALDERDDFLRQSIESLHQNIQTLYETVSKNREDIVSLREDVKDLVQVSRTLLNSAGDHDKRIKGLEDKEEQ